MPQQSSAVADDEYGLEKAPAGRGVTDSEYGLEPVNKEEPPTQEQPKQEPWYQRFPRALLHSTGLPETLGDVPRWATQGIPGLDKTATHVLPEHKEDIPIIGPITKAVAKPTNENITGAVPFIGPASVEAAKSFGKGDYASGLGHLTAAASPAIAPAAVKAAPEAVSKVIGKVNAARNTLAEKAVSPLVYENVGETAADRRLGVNPESGIVNEGHVGTKQSLLEQAQKRTADLKKAANNILQNHPKANVQIDVEPMIDQAIDEAIAKSKKVAGSTERLENLRGALKSEYGPITGNPLEMNNLKTDIQKAANELGAYKNTQPAEASAAAAMKNVAKRIKDEVNHHIPEAADLNERMANSIDAQSGLQRHIDASKGESVFGGFHEGTIPRLLNRTLGSAPVRSGVARVLNAGNIEAAPSPLPPIQPIPPARRLPTPATPLGNGPDTSGPVNLPIPEGQPVVPVPGGRFVRGLLPGPVHPEAPVAPPPVPGRYRIEPIGSPTSDTQIGTRGGAGVRNIKLLPGPTAEVPPAGTIKPIAAQSELPATVAPVVKEAGWQFEGKNGLGQYIIRMPGTEVRLHLFERDLQPDFIRRQILAKEKQYGTPGPMKK